MVFSPECSPNGYRTIRVVIACSLLHYVALPAFGIEFDDPEVFTVKRTWTVDDLGIDLPEEIFFSPDGNVLYVASAWNDPQGSAFYSLDVIRVVRGGNPY